MIDRICGQAESMRSQITTAASALISIPTENPPGANGAACAELLQAMLAEVGCSVEVVDVDGEPESGEGEGDGETTPWRTLIATFGSGARTLYFHGHYDVVPASDRAQFSPCVRDGRLFGRGAADMKGALASMIAALQILRDLKATLRGRIELVLTPDEETGGPHGTRRLAVSKRLDPQAIGMLLPEPSGGVIWSACRGAISGTVEVKGRSVHVGVQHEGRNAFEDMLQVAGALQSVKRIVEQRLTGFHIEPDEARRSIFLLGGQCSSGDNFNIVPGRCAFTFDRRTNPEEDHDEERRRILDAIVDQRAHGIDVACHIHQDELAAAMPPDAPLTRALAHVIERVVGSAPSVALCPGLLETRFHAGLGIPALAYGPGSLSEAHSPTESVEIDELVRCAAIYACSAARLLE